jgi:D-alanine-D-alanine ligase
MNSKRKIRVAVLYGGRSGEHEVSMLSGASVVKHLDRSRFDVLPIGIDKQGTWHLNNADKLLAENDTSLLVQTDSSQPMALPERSLREVQGIDVVFPAVHGPLCEDGSVQGLLELAGLPYVGSGVLSSAICMDKAVSKALLGAAGVPMVKYQTVVHRDWQHNAEAILQQIIANLIFPLFVKPCNLGSSVGIHKVTEASELRAAINDALSYDLKVLVEQDAKAREIEVALLENLCYGEAPLVSKAGEIIINPKYPFYNYEAKYQDPDSLQLVIPADITEAQYQRITDIAQVVFSTLQCEGMARMDFFVTKQGGEVLFNEANTLPGFTSMSMYPLMWQASGKSYSELLSYLIELALARHERQANIKRTY